MTIAGEDLLEVNESGGELGLGLFPGLTQPAVETILDGYLTAAYQTTGALSSGDADSAARAYGYWKSYERRLDELAGMGRGQISLAGQFTVGTTAEQIAELRRKADYWRGEYLALLPASASGPNVLPSTSRTISTPSTW